MAEYIDKHEAYKILKDLEAAYMQVAVKEAYGKAALHIDQLRPKDVQPVKRGHWIETDYGMFYECSECGHVQEFERNFCSKCGADMREHEAIKG